MAKKKKRTKLKNKNILNNSVKPSISVCLIVKDEERFLDNCLKSVKDIAGEIIIVDTGSKDRTVEIAKKYTDKIYFHPWKDNYSEARNHYLDYAKGDWIFQIDADEELVKEDIPILLNAVKNPSIDVIMLQIISHLGRGKSESRHSLERLFRNNGLIHYEGRIHERLIGFKRPRIYPLRLMHYGYDLNDEDLSEKKHDRRIRLLKMDIEEYPDNPLPYHYLSCCYLSRNLLYETIDVCLKAIELAERQNNKNSVFLWSRYNASIAYYKLKDFKNAESMALSAIALDKRHLDSHFILIPLYLDQSKWHEAIKYGNEYLFLTRQFKKKPEEFGTIVCNSISKYWKIFIWMGIAYYETENKKEAEQSFRTAASHASDPFNALKTIGIYYYNKALFPQAREYLKKALDINKEDAVVNELLTKNGKHGSIKEEMDCLEKVGEIGAKDNFDSTRLFSLYMENGQYTNALKLINCEDFSNSNLYPELIKLGNIFIKKREMEAGIQCYMKAIQIRPETSEAWNILGEVTLAMGRLEDSLVFLEKALQIDNKNTAIILALCELELKIGDIDSHIKYCDMLLERLSLPRDRVIDSFNDLKSIFMEIESALNDDKSHSKRISNIIAQLHLKNYPVTNESQAYMVH
jgi:glycosyltransferase involved in cell wall biosynthesis